MYLVGAGSITEEEVFLPSEEPDSAWLRSIGAAGKRFSCPGLTPAEKYAFKNYALCTMFLKCL